MIKAPCSITVDTKGNRYYSQPYKPAKTPPWVEWESVMPMVMVEIEHINEAIKQYRAWNQARVNEILSQYF